MTRDEFLTALDSLIAEKHLLKHPFYRLWSRGELTLETLREYAISYYPHVAAFPTYVSGVHAGCEDAALRQELLENLIEEERGTENHPAIWRKFAAALGAAETDLVSAPRTPEVAEAIAEFRRATREGSTAEGLAALYAYESQIPAICESKIDGLKKHYGFNDPEHYRYFSVHLEADREHSAAEREMLMSYIDNDNFGKVRTATQRILDALWEMLTGVCRRHAIAC